MTENAAAVTTVVRRALDRARPDDEALLTDDTAAEIVAATERDLYAGATGAEAQEALVGVLTARVERDPAYKRLAAAVFRNQHYREVTGEEPGPDGIPAAGYREAFRAGIERGVEADVLDERMMEYDLAALAEYLEPARDDRLEHMAMTTLAQRYFLTADDDPIELPQSFWMRVAMGIALREPDDERLARAKQFYDALSSLRFVFSTPTLFHAGTTHPQLSSCYLTTVPDDLEGIFDSYKAHAKLSKWSGGLGNDWTNVRAAGARIASTGVESTGTVPFLDISNERDRGDQPVGKASRAACAYLEPWHLDFPAFLDLKRNTGDERRRTHEMNTAAWVPDLFMKRVQNDGEWTLFSPDETPDLHETYGEEFERRYREYERQADAGEIDQYERRDAADLWRTMLTRLFETGHPWLTFKDACNVRSPQDHAGVINSSNLCTEITLNTSDEETAVCNLGSVNLARHVTHADGDETPGNGATADAPLDGIDRERLADTIETAMRMLDNVVDLNFYPTDRAERSNMRHRPIGLGMMGFHEALLEQGVPMASEDAIDFADRIAEFHSYHAILNSSRLARERGTYDSYAGSKWDRDLFPQDTVSLLEAERDREIPIAVNERLDWEEVREHVANHGMRNSNTMAIAPTATISTIAGTTPSIEPLYSNLYVKSNMSGEFTVVNDHLVADLDERDLWDDEMLDRIKYHDGSIQEIADIPAELRERHRSAFEIDPRHQLELAANRGIWLDQSQSVNVFFPSTNGSLLDDVYRTAWELGLKTTYYLRTLGASQFEKSTIDMAEYGRTQTRDVDEPDGGTDTDERTDHDLPSVEDPTCEACQ